jgi:hypothetical protein
LQRSQVFRKFVAPRVGRLASFALPTELLTQLDHLARTQSERRHQSQNSKTSEDGNTSALFGSFSASNQLG